MTLEKIVVIARETQLEELLRRHSTASQVRYFLESRGASFESYKQAHDAYKTGLAQTLASIPRTMRSQVVDKKYLPTFQFGDKDLVVVVGDDGLVVNVAKYVGNQPVISLNSDKQRFDGVLSCCTPATFPRVLQDVMAEGKPIPLEMLTMAQAILEDGQTLYALNDFFIGRKDHASARYCLQYAGKKENQSSDGIIVSTGTGSTGWLTSIRAGADALATGKAKDPSAYSFARTAEYLQFAVRNPFPSKITGISVVTGDVTCSKPLTIFSHMPPDEGVIFSDGIQQDYMEFAAGKTVTIRPADKKVHLVRVMYT